MGASCARLSCPRHWWQRLSDWCGNSASRLVFLHLSDQEDEEEGFSSFRCSMATSVEFSNPQNDCPLLLPLSPPPFPSTIRLPSVQVVGAQARDLYRSARRMRRARGKKK